MNQAIQVLDGYIYIEAKNALKIDVMAAGQMLVCYVCGSDQVSLTKLYNAKQFEIEEIIDLELKQDKLNSDGEIWLTVEQVRAY